MSANTPKGLSIEDRIHFEALDRLYNFSNEPGQLYLSGLVPLLVAVVMWPVVEHALMIAWLIAFFLAIIYNRLTIRAYVAQLADQRLEKSWGTRLAFSAGLYGVLWATAVLAFFPQTPDAHQVFLSTVAILLSSGAFYRGMHWPPLAYVYMLPILAALSIRFVIKGGTEYWILAFFIVWSSVFVVQITQKINRVLNSEMRLRHQSADLSAALRKKTNEAETAVQAKSRFLAAASHDLRQPLHALNLFVDALKTAKSRKDQGWVITRIEHSLDALKKLFDGLLDVSRLDAQVVVPNPQNFDLAGLVYDLADEFSAYAQSRRLKLRLHLKPTNVLTDRVLLERILRNLLGNAIHYTESGGVLIALRSRDGRVLLQIWDTGIGIEEIHQEEIFHEFTQLHNAHRDRAEGIGLGLAIVERLCRLLDIPIELKSTPNRGSVFSLLLKRADSDRDKAPDSKQHTTTWDLTNRNALVIDDEREIVDATRALLSAWGMKVVVGQTLSEAVDGLERSSLIPDIMLVDLRLADQANGCHVMDEIRAHFGKSIPGILITGDTGPEKIAMAQSSSYTVLHKPVRPPQLRSVIQQLLRNSAGTEANNQAAD
jgi:two-component system, sensor histidine kinase